AVAAADRRGRQGGAGVRGQERRQAQGVGGRPLGADQLEGVPVPALSPATFEALEAGESRLSPASLWYNGQASKGLGQSGQGEKGMIPTNQRQEALSRGYVQAVAARAGMICVSIDQDFGFDLILRS